MQLDHAVVNTQYALDRAQTCFRALGFNLTERGFHSLGSINHLMIFGTDYLELIGLPETPAQPGQERPTRAGVSDAPVGINGLVFKTASADETYEHLQRIGMAGDPPKSFTRPVTLPDEQRSREASFRTVHVRSACFPAGRVYFCEHHTPELVWQPQWQTHDNGATSIAAIVLVAPDAAQQADALATMLSLSARPVSDDEICVEGDAFAIEVITPPIYEQRYAVVAGNSVRPNSFFGALRIRTTEQSFLQRAAKALGYPLSVTQADPVAQRTLLRQPEFDTVLEFVTV